jgi:hypothetical protein
MVHAPQHCLGAAANTELAIDRADVGFHRVGAQIRQPCNVGVAHTRVISARISASRSVRPSPRAGQSNPGALRAREPTSLTITSPACTASRAATSSRAGSVLDRYPCAPCCRALSRSRHHPADRGISAQDLHPLDPGDRPAGYRRDPGGPGQHRTRHRWPSTLFLNPCNKVQRHTSGMSLPASQAFRS